MVKLRRRSIGTFRQCLYLGLTVRSSRHETCQWNGNSDHTGIKWHRGDSYGGGNPHLKRPLKHRLGSLHQNSSYSSSYRGRGSYRGSYDRGYVKTINIVCNWFNVCLIVKEIYYEKNVSKSAKKPWRTPFCVLRSPISFPCAGESA